VVLLANKANRISSEDAGDRLKRQQLLDDALQLAIENFEEGENLGLVYSRFEGHRCLAEVRFRRGELDEAERICVAASDFVSKTESRVCQLWLGPLHINVLMAVAKQAENEDRTSEAAAKRRFATELLAGYQELVKQCQAPGFTREAERLAVALSAR
jgi:hypothetical protein